MASVISFPNAALLAFLCDPLFLLCASFSILHDAFEPDFFPKLLTPLCSILILSLGRPSTASPQTTLTSTFAGTNIS